MNTTGGSEATDVGLRRLALIVEGTAPIGAVLAPPLAALGWRSVIAHGPEHAHHLAGELAFDLLVAEADLGDTSGEVLAAGLTMNQARPVVLVSNLHAAAGIELWWPAAFMPTVHSIDTLLPALGGLLDQQHVALLAEPVSPSVSH